jgi:deoxyribodipyrimidine photo-lyase
MRALFIFRRDLRTFDNTSLNKLVIKYPTIEILPIFIFNKKQIEEKSNKYYSKNSAQFLFESLDELSFLNFYYTDTDDISIIDEIYKKNKFDIISYNKDYTPYAIKRDNDINNWANKNKIEIMAFEDYTLNPIKSILKDNNEPYLKFTPFYKKAILKKTESLFNNKKFKFIKDNNSKTLKDYNYLRPVPNIHIFVNGGRIKALEILERLKNGYYNNYDDERNYPYLNKTTRLSAYIKFGCISIREIYYTLPLNHGIIRELFWHDFYAIITFHFPYIFQKSFNKK